MHGFGLTCRWPLSPEAAFESRADIAKPVDFEKLVTQVKAFNAYWCSVVELPSG